jgi:cation:H+ antiporter
MITVFLLLGAGLLLLLAGAEWLVRGSSRLAVAMGISPLVIGLTIVAFGTSAPELATSVFAAYHGRGDIALGNVVGSNIANIGLVLGLAGLLRPIIVQDSLNDRLIPFLLIISVILWFFGRSLDFSRVEGLVFLGLFAGYIWYCLQALVWRTGKKKVSRRRPAGGEGPATVPGGSSSLYKPALLVIAGLAMLGAGAEFLVRGAVQFAQLVGVSEAVVGVTVVALGTSLPELAAAVVAAARKMPSLALGNIVGSNIFNILAITGFSAAVFPFAVSSPLVAFSVPAMLVFTVLLMIICYTRKAVSRGEAGLALLLTILYVVLLLRYG